METVIESGEYTLKAFLIQYKVTQTLEVRKLMTVIHMKTTT